MLGTVKLWQKVVMDLRPSHCQSEGKHPARRSRTYIYILLLYFYNIFILIAEFCKLKCSCALTPENCPCNCFLAVSVIPLLLAQCNHIQQHCPVEESADGDKCVEES